ncbi:MAG: hypothetical protein QOK37_1956 [Thermoanaerobaculia bacterium]|jgi:hypothetical protein|nr:hypothetical protein [Thermoanaerobaculia bacterium]
MDDRDRRSAVPEVSRRVFAGAVPLLVISLTNCAGAFGDRTRFAEAFIVDPDWPAYRPILGGLIRIILPLDEPNIPLHSPEPIEERLIAMFPLEKEQKFLGLQRTLVLFNQIDLFPIVSGPLLFEEARVRDDDRESASLTAGLMEEDRRSYRDFIHAHSITGRPRFEDLPGTAQQAYFALWRDSPSIVKRAFHSTMRALIMTTFYSMDEVWPSIGYAGPLVGKKTR